nr:cytochrome P450 [Tanacetum cinerariifolium]
YAPQEQRRKRKLWKDITQLFSIHNTLTIVLGDFNEVRNVDERKGTMFDPRVASRFNNFISSSGLIDLPMGAKRFTRMNNLGIELSKIDRIIVSQHVIDLWRGSHMVALPREFLDHTPILLSNMTTDFGPPPFKLYNSWLSHKNFPQLVEECWTLRNVGPVLIRPGNSIVSFECRLQNLKNTIKQWRRKVCETENLALVELHKMDDCLDMKAELSFLNDEEISLRISHIKTLADIKHRRTKDLRKKNKK